MDGTTEVGYEWSPDPTPSWFRFAACKGMTDLFFPPVDDGRAWSPGPALRVCSTCPVRRSCLEMFVGEQRGVWGGTTARERFELRRRRRDVA